MNKTKKVLVTAAAVVCVSTGFWGGAVTATFAGGGDTLGAIVAATVSLASAAAGIIAGAAADKLEEQG